MKKPLLSRIFGLAVLYCAVFFFVVILQFTNKGNFTLSSGAMTVKGRYLDPQADTAAPEARPLAGGVKIFFGGLEFNLKDNSEKGLLLTSSSGQMPVNPASVILNENSFCFVLPGGTAITFSPLDSQRGAELQISAQFADNISEAAIPISPRRSSTVRESGQLGILYNGSRYLFNGAGAELENGKLVLSRENTFISYRSRGNQKEFDTSDYIIAQSQNYESAVAGWRDSSFTWWGQNAAALQNADDVAAYCSEAIRRGNYNQAVASISANYLNGSRHSHIASGYVGSMVQAFRTLTAEEQETTNRIFRLARERSMDIFKEEHLFDYLLVRGNIALANDVLELLQNTDGKALTAEHCAGLLEFYSDFKRWRPASANPVEPLTDQILLLLSESLSRDVEKDIVHVTYSGKTTTASLRLGTALLSWADDAGKSEWEAIGRSLILSALTTGGTGAGELYNALALSDYHSRAAWLSDNGLWAWTVSPSARASYVNGNLNMTFSFPANMSHYVIISGVRPFIKLQVHDMDWRSDSQFERYDSSGWVYYPQEQILIVKLKHRVTVESVRVFYRVEAPPPVIIEENTADNYNGGDNFDF